MATADLRAPKPKPSTTTLSKVPDPLYHTFRADVQAQQGGGPTPTGSVTFKDGTVTLATTPLGGSYDATTVPKTVTATYSGDDKYQPSTSNTLTGPFAAAAAEEEAPRRRDR